MDRARRRRLAEELAAKIVRSRQDLVAVILFGSVARGDDLPDSDVEMYAIVRRGRWRAQQFVLGGILFTVYWSSAIGMRADMLQVGADATRHGFLDGVALYDPKDWYPRLRKEILSLPSSYYRGCAQLALGYAYEYLCKARNARRRGDRQNLVYATFTVAHEALVVVSLVNHRHFTSENTMFREWREFPDLPRGFGPRLQPCLMRRGSDDGLLAATEDLWRSVRAWAARHGVQVRAIRALREVRVPKTT